MMPVKAPSLDFYLEQQRMASDAALARALSLVSGETQVAQAMRYALAGGGKRLRPALCAACYEAVARQPADERIADLGCAVELIHTYSLVHDDLPCMDDDDVRRGRPTTHRIFGDRVAASAGMALMPLAFRVADRATRDLCLTDGARVDIARTLARAAGAVGMVGGQVVDLFANLGRSDLAALEQMHAAKTAALLRAACRLGGLAARARPQQLDALEAYGAHLGLAFQITDDVLDETASSEQLGKTAGKDRQFAKATFPAILGVTGAVERAATEMVSAVAALEKADLEPEVLSQLARFAVERKR